MSHIDAGPLARYNSLTDPHLAGYFSGLRIKRHLRKSGLVTRHGEIVSETMLRVNNARHEHKRHVRELLAQAIVHRTLDAERGRQVAVRKKLEEIAKIELVRRVQAELGRKGDEEILPYLTPRESKKSRPSSVPAGCTRPVRRPISAPITKTGTRKRSTSVRLDMGFLMDGVPGREKSSIPPAEGDSKGKGHRKMTSSKYLKDEIDDRHLYALDQHALREYLARERALASSPYQCAQLAIDREPTQPTGRQRSPNTLQRNRRRLQKPAEKDVKAMQKSNKALMLHRQEPAMRHQERMQTMCEVSMHYFGGRLRLDYERFDLLDEVTIEQQHCGGNTLIVFRGKVAPGTDFQFVSRRHRGFPFSLTLYVNGSLVGRVSACCEYKHAAGSRLGGMQGKFGVVGVSGAAPCYRCHVKQEMKENEKKQTSRQTKRMVSDDGAKVPVSDDGTKVPVSDDVAMTSASVNVVGMSDNFDTTRETGRSVNGIEVSVEDEEDAEDKDKEQDESYDYSEDDFEADDQDKISDKENDANESDTTTDKVDCEKNEKQSENDNESQQDTDKEFGKESDKENDSSIVEKHFADYDEDDDDKNSETKLSLLSAHDKSPSVHSSSDLSSNKECEEAAAAVVSKEDDDNVIQLEHSHKCSELQTTGTQHEVSDFTAQQLNSAFSRAKRAEVIGPERNISESEDEQIVPIPYMQDVIKQDVGDKVQEDNGSNASLDSSRSSMDSTDSDAETEYETDMKMLYKQSASSETESENLAGGHDPDNVASGVVDIATRPLNSTKHHEGSIKSMIERQQEIALMNITLTRQQVFELAKEVKESDMCEILLLSNCSLDAERLAIIAEALSTTQNGNKLRMLNLNSNCLGADSVASILQIVKSSPQLERLLLHDNPLSDEGCGCLLNGLQLLHQEQISKRHLAAIVSTADTVVADVMADVVGPDYIQENLKTTTTKVDTFYEKDGKVSLEQLDLADVGMAAMSVEALGQLLTEGVHIGTLGVGGNKRVMQEASWRPVAEALSVSHGDVKTLSLERNNLGDAGIAVISAAIASNTTIQVIDLEDNDIGETGAQSLLKAMQVNSTLADVTLTPGNEAITTHTANDIKQLASINAAG